MKDTKKRLLEMMEVLNPDFKQLNEEPTPLKMVTKTVNIIDYHDFDRFITDTYGGDFEFTAVHEANNYSQYSFKAPNMAMDFDGEVEAQIRQGEYPEGCVHILFNVLLKDGHIKEGEYIIDVSW